MAAATSRHADGEARTWYAGPDRRSTGGERAPDGRPFVAAVALLLLVFLTLTVAARRAWELPSWFDEQALNVLLVAFATVLAVVVGVLYLMRWRLVGETAALRVGIATLLLAAGAYAAHDLLRTVVTPAHDETLFMTIRAATLTVVLPILGAAIFGPEVDTRVRPRLLVAGAGAAVAISWALLSVLPYEVTELLGGAASLPNAGSVGSSGQALIGLVWLALATVALVRGLRSQRWLFTWTGLMLAGFALASVGSAGVVGTDQALWLTGGALLELVALAFAVYGGAEELRRAWAQQQMALLDTRRDLQTREAHWQAELAARQELAHDARSMILAIQGAVSGLEATHDELDADTRSMLARAVGEEIGRLRSLVAPAAESSHEPAPFAVDELLSSVVACHRSTDLGLGQSYEDDLVAVGRADATGEVVHSLLDNARRHAAGSPVTVRARRELGNVVVRVEDRGPGVDPREREAIFERGRRGSNAAPGGSGLGLSTARRLMREQGGDVWVEGRPGGGASFVLFLPGTAPDDAASQPRDHGQPGDHGQAPDQAGEAPELERRTAR